MRGAILVLGLSLCACGKKAPPTIAADPSPSSAPSAAPSVVMADSTERIAASKPVRVLASGQRAPWGIFVDDGTVWWTNKGKGRGDGELLAVPKGGGPVTSVQSGLDSPYGIAVGDGFLAVGLAHSASGGYLLKKVTESSAAPIALPGHEPWSLTIRAGFLYFGDLGSRTIERVALEGDASARTVLASTKGRPVGLALDETHAYFTDSDPGAVAKVPLAGGPVVELYRGGDKTTGIAVDATHVYWSEWGSGRIVKVPKEGGAVTVLATDQKGARAIAIDGARVYFTNPPTGSIRSVAKSGGAVTVHATGQKHPYSVAVDATAIYWANVDGDTVAAVDK